MPSSPAGEGGNILYARELARTFRYWESARRERKMPSREDINPMELRDVLPHIVLVDVERAPLRFRYRLVGTYVTGISGRDITGRYADTTTFRQSLHDVVGPYTMVVENGAPVGKVGEARWVPNRPWVRLETLLLPLGRDDRQVDIILGAIAQPGRGIDPDRGSETDLSFRGVRVFFDPTFAPEV